MVVSYLHELRLAFRGLLREPTVLASAVLCLSGGIGVSSVMLGVFDLLYLRPPAHVEEPDSVKRVYFIHPSVSWSQSIVSYPAYADLGSVRAFSDLAAFGRSEASLGRGPEARRVRIAFATPSFFHLLGVKPVRGRLFTPAEGDPERPEGVALVSWELWQGAFGGASDILERTLPIGDRSYSVVGVLPPRFTGVDIAPLDLWLPIGAAGPLWAGAGWSSQRGSSFLKVVVRLSPGASVRRAELEATAVHRHAALTAGDAQATAATVSLFPVQLGKTPDGAGQSRLAAWLAGSSGGVLLIACANAAGLLVVRGLGRGRELGVRAALGASRGQMFRLLLSESLVLALLAGTGGWLLARWGGGLVRAFFFAAAPSPPSLDLRVLALIASLSLVAGLVSGLGPAFWGSRGALAEALGAGRRELGTGRARFRAVVLAVQAAVCLLLLVGAGLFLKSLSNVYNLPVGFDRDGTFVVTTNLGATGTAPPEVDAFFRRALDRVRQQPGVEHAAVAAGIPVRNSFGTTLAVSGRGDVTDAAPGGVYFNGVSDDFFLTLGTRLVRGRALAAGDESGTERVAVVNQTLAKALWPGGEPLGQCLQVPSSSAPCTKVVGVVEDVLRGQLREPPTMQLYIPLRQAPEGMTSRVLLLRANGKARLVAAAVRREMQALDPDVPFVEVRPLSEVLDGQTRSWRMGASLLSLFAGLALLLAVVGIYSSVAYAVRARTAELGLRMALGARFSHLLWEVLRFALGLAFAGVLAGLAISLLLGRFVEPLLFEIHGADILVLSFSAITVLLAALGASLYPALRVRRIDPAVAMRTE